MTKRTEQVRDAIARLSFRRSVPDCHCKCYDYPDGGDGVRTVGLELGHFVIFESLDEIGLNSLYRDYGQLSKLRELDVGEKGEAFCRARVAKLRIPLPPVPVEFGELLSTVNGMHCGNGYSLCGVHVPSPNSCLLRPAPFVTYNVFETHGRRSHELIIGTKVLTDHKVLFLDANDGRVSLRLPHSDVVTEQWDSMWHLVLDAMLCIPSTRV